MMRKRRTPRSEVSIKERKQIDGDAWRATLEAISINEDGWWCMVIMMVETITEHSECVSIFNAAAEEGTRKAIYPLSYQKTMDLVRALSNQNLDKCPTIQGVCHYATKVLNEDNGVLSSWLMARIIKFLIYRAKEECVDTVKRLADLEREIDNEYLIMQTVANWEPPKSKGYGLEAFNFKANTKLRKRNEEWRDVVYIDDAPLNGPNLYIILTGFHDPDLPEHLINAGVPLTCILRIKRPNEHLDRNVESGRTKFSATKRLQFDKTYNVDKMNLLNFWTMIENRSMHPGTYSEYCDIALRTYCPPKIKRPLDKEEYKTMKSEMYDSVSYFVYDIYDLYRQHSNYLKSMKVEKFIVETIKRNVDMKIYEAFLNDIPPECVSVPLILIAMLMQLETDEKKSLSENRVDEKGDAKVSEITIASAETEVKPISPNPIKFVESKLETLNSKFGLNRENGFNNDEQYAIDIDLIHDDALNEAIHLSQDSNFDVLNVAELIDNILPIFSHPSIMVPHSQHELPEKKQNEYSRHINKMRRYFDAEMSDEEVKHYLHILMFDKMILNRFQPHNETVKSILIEKLESIKDLHSSGVSLKRSNSFPSLTPKLTREIQFQSDSNVDYGKIVPTVIECAPLFDLIDPRELLVPGYLSEKLFREKERFTLSLENLNDVEPLSKVAFLQLFYECLQSFDHFESRYFEPTDSLLLYFGYKRIVNGVYQEERMSSIRTPVCLRDFTEYVVAEEEDWIRREEALYILQTTESIERLMRKSTEIYDEMLLFRDEDFILPGSLKARDLEKRGDFLKRKRTLEIGPSSPEETVESSRNAKKKSKEATKRVKRKDDKIATEEARSKLSLDAGTSTTKRSSLADKVREEATYEFVGYDLGRLRVQVRNIRKTFYSMDETLVQVEIDDWLYNDKDIRITVTIHGYNLRLYHRINVVNHETSKTFHLTSKTGIILAFEKFLTPLCEQTSFRDGWQCTSVKFKASWPTGLMIEPVADTGSNDSFYICQSYATSKNYSSVNGVREVSRKFLRNGTVLKYLDDGKIIVLRPNGVIVTCKEFEKLQVKLHDSFNDASLQRGGKPSERTGFPKSRKKSMSSLKSEVARTMEGVPVRLQQSSTTNSDNVLSVRDTTVKVSRYTVLDHDGGRYEVLDDLVVCEHHRLLVRTASDYEVDEKFTRRADGTNMLLNSNGELIVEFSDGTRITTGYTIEKEPVMCDWTEEEILRYFALNGVKKQNSYVADISSSNAKFFENASSELSLKYKEEMTELLIEDGFVSVLLTCCVEHKNYATVFYDQSTVSCTLSMPDDLRVSISRIGYYEVSMADGVNLKIEDDSLSFKGNACNTCGSQSTSTYNFFLFESPAVIFFTKDVFENVFEVMSDGTTRYRHEESAEGHKSDLIMDTLESDESEENYMDRRKMVYDGNECFDRSCDHGNLCFRANDIRHRIFSMNRNLTAYEYLHRSIIDQAELAATFDNETSMISYQSLHRKLRRLIMFNPLKYESRTKTQLTFQRPELMPTNFDRRKLLRSTYSIPYNWLYPFGRNNNGVWKNTHHLPLTNGMEQKPPKLLRTQILYGFKERGENAVIDLQRALGRYWMSLTHKNRHLPLESKSELTKTALEEADRTIYQHLDKNLHNLAFGIIKTIDSTAYKRGLKKCSKVSKRRVPIRSSKFDALLKERSLKGIEIEWYRRCMRERIILPYFQNITGMCFLWIERCAILATKIANRSAAMK